MVGDPLRHGPLHRHAAENREYRLHRGMGREAAMGEVAVEADRRSERADHVQGDEENEVDRVERDSPENAHRGEEPDRWDEHCNERHDLADRARPGPDGADG